MSVLVACLSLVLLTKMFDKSNVRREGLFGLHYEGTVHTGGKAWQQECGVAGHVMSILEKQSNECGSFILWCHSDLGWVFLPQLGQSRNNLTGMPRDFPLR